MAYGFDEYKNKVEVYPASEVYSKDEVYSKNESYSKEEVYSKNEIEGLFVMENIEWSDITLGPTIFAQTKVVTKTGYRLLGIVGFGADYVDKGNYIQYVKYTPINGQNDDAISLTVRNSYHTTFTASFYFTCLYIKVEE